EVVTDGGVSYEGGGSGVEMVATSAWPKSGKKKGRRRLGGSGWSSDEWRWCSGGAGCRRAAAVEMVTGGSKGVSGVACRGLNRSGRWGVFWSSPENFRRKKNLRRRRWVVAAGWLGREREE
nr:hypothetical protein [Tanacetum cinerariifolium]